MLRDNKFFEVIFKRLAVNQIRDGDFALSCRVMEDENGRRIQITPAEDLLKILVGWDDATGTSFSFIAYRDFWTLSKIKREFGYDAEPFEKSDDTGESVGAHGDEYGMFTQNAPSGKEASVPSGQNKLPKAMIVDYWGYEVINGAVKIVNLILINNECVQFVVTDYKRINWFIGHSFVVAGKPYSMGFIDPLIDPQIELNDRTAEEGDLVRIGAHMKFLAINVPDFDEKTIKPGSGQVIFIEGENADFRPLIPQISNTPAENYINRMLEHMFTLGIPKIALAAGTAPYTGRVGAIQYQPFADLINDLRIQWEIVMRDMFREIQQYFIDYFPETHSFMTEHISDENGGYDGDLVIRDVEFDWDNVLPLSRSDKVVDASTMRDRNAISLHTYLKEAGYRNPDEEIKKLIKESNDPEIQAVNQKFLEFSKGATELQIDSQRAKIEAEEASAEMLGGLSTQPSAREKATPPILTPEQNSGRRNVMPSSGTPTGQTASLKGAVNQKTQNMNAQNGV